VANGVHPGTWACSSFAQLYEERLRGWRHEPELLNRIDQVPDELLWQAHRAAKQILIERVRQSTGVALDPELPILAFARRMAAYKRPDLLFFDVERLQRIARTFPFQLVIAGKAHPQDQAGKQLIELLHRYRTQLSASIPIAFLPNYGMQLALEMVSGADVWINTPLPPLEASGTSGMKAAFNGVPQLSTLDGWWAEGYMGQNGWAIPQAQPGEDPDQADAGRLFDLLEQQIVPMYYRRDARGLPVEWLQRMKQAIKTAGERFSARRMVQEYVNGYYAPSMRGEAPTSVPPT